MTEKKEKRIAAVFLGGDAPGKALAPLLSECDHVIAADSGAVHALALGRLPDLVLGDFDSLPAATQDRLSAAGVPMRRFPSEKDQTDGELAILTAAEQNWDEIRVFAWAGGRPDHLLGNLMLLARFPELPLFFVEEDVRIFLVRGQAALSGPAGAGLSLIPLSECRGVKSSGLRYPLRGETLFLGSSRGLSNELLGGPATVSLETGLLLLLDRTAAGGPAEEEK